MISLASVAHENSYVRPFLTNEKILEIKSGRHPLQEICVSDFVPNDTYASIDYGLMKILTGPNACGKSIYLKQVNFQFKKRVILLCFRKKGYLKINHLFALC